MTGTANLKLGCKICGRFYLSKNGLHKHTMLCKKKEAANVPVEPEVSVSQAIKSQLDDMNAIIAKLTHNQTTLYDAHANTLQVQQQEFIIQQQELQIQQQMAQLSQLSQLTSAETQLANVNARREQLVEKTILDQYQDNVECVYFGIIDDKSEDGEPLIKFGSSNNLIQRVAQHKKTYTNFRLVGAFRVGNKVLIENTMKSHPALLKYRRVITISGANYVELLAQITPEYLSDIIKDIIQSVEFNPDNYYKMAENYYAALEQIKKLTAVIAKVKGVLTDAHTP